jgi:hypothetical protein
VGFELRTSCFLGRCSTSTAAPPALRTLDIWEKLKRGSALSWICWKIELCHAWVKYT